MRFRKYMHLERYGNSAVQGIELGDCYIFPKLDGTNASIWCDGETKRVCAGSRNRQLSYEADNAGFFKWMQGHSSWLSDFFSIYPHITVYGEWLVPHTLKTYHDDAWRKFYVFDMYDHNEERYLNYHEWVDMAQHFKFDFVPCLMVLKNVDYDSLLKQLEANTFLVQDGKGIGEGIVVKNYDYTNQWGNTVFAKVVATKFKDEHMKFKLNKKEVPMIEQQFVDGAVDQHLIDKTFAKIANDNEGWNSKYIPQLLGRVQYDAINEELWDFLKKQKFPTINFRTVNALIIRKIKELKPELF